MSRSVWLVRHGNRLDFIQPEWFLSSPLPYDPPLCSEGKIQAKEVAEHFRIAIEQKVDYLFVSPFLRTIQTAKPLAIATNCKVKIEAGLGEWLNPEWMSGTPQLNLDSKKDRNIDSLQIDSSYESKVKPSYPEDQVAVLERSAKTMEIVLQQTSGNVVIIGHKASLEGCAIALLGKKPDFTFDVCSISEFYRNGDRWETNYVNQSSHLSSPGVKVAPMEANSK